MHQSGPDLRTIGVTHVVVELDGGGLETLVGAIARHVAGTEIRMSVVSLSERPGRMAQAIAPLLARYETVRQARGMSMLLPTELTHAIRRTAPQVVHIHSGCWYKAALAATRAGVPGIIYTEHGREHDDPAFARWLDRRAGRRTDAIVAVSDRLARYLADVVGVPGERIQTIQNGVDTSVLVPGRAQDLRRRLGIPEDAYVVGSLGRLETVKAYERLVDVVAELRGAGTLDRPVVGIIWGEGTQRRALEERIKSKGLVGAFHLPGWTQAISDAHRLLDVFVLTSDSEGASVSLMESLASGVAPVVTNVGANAEVVGPDLRRQVVPVGDGRALRSAIEATLSDAGKRAEVGAAGRQWVVRHHSLDAMVESYVSLYRALSGRVSARRAGNVGIGVSADTV